MLFSDNLLSAKMQARCPINTGSWSETTPLIDHGHILCGDINRHGHATGYHHRPGGRDTSSARIGAVSKINADTGVYIATTVQVWNGTKWVDKKNISSFFPDNCQIKDVMRSIAFAARNFTCRYASGKWSGPSAPDESSAGFCRGKDGKTLLINGYFRHGYPDHVATAWPLIEGRNRPGCLAP